MHPRAAPRVLSSPTIGAGYAHSPPTHTGSARLSLGGAATQPPPPSHAQQQHYAPPGKSLAMSHLASPAPAGAANRTVSPSRPLHPGVGAAGASAAVAAAHAATRRSAIATITSPEGDHTYVWSPTKGHSLSVPKSPQRTSSSSSSSNTHMVRRSSVHHQTSFASTQQRSHGRSPASSPVRSPDVPASASPPVSSLLDSMSELRALIAKKELELSSLAHARGAQQGPLSTSFSGVSSMGSSTVHNGNSVFSQANPMSPPSGSSQSASTLALQQSNALLASQLQSAQQAQTAHELSLRDQEIHDSSLRILSLEQTLLEREEMLQEVKVEAARLKAREEATHADSEVRAQAHRKQMELLQSNLESLTWNRHESLEKQREEFERLRKEMLDELVRKEEAAHQRTAQLNQNLLNYEEHIRTQNAQLEEWKAQAAKEADKARESISKLEAEVETLRHAKASSKEQVNSGIKQQLSMASQLKALSRKLEDTQRSQEAERMEYLTHRQRQEAEAARVRLEMEAKSEELLHQLRQVESSLVENERASTLALQRAELQREELLVSQAAERESLLEQAHAEKRALVDEFTQKSSESASALAASQSLVSRLERDLQEQRNQLVHEATLAQESWNNLVLEKEREIQQGKMELLTAQTSLSSLREQVASLEGQVSSLRVAEAQLQSDLRHAREQIDEAASRAGEVRAQHKHELEEKALQHSARIDELQLRLLKSERESEERDRNLAVERARTAELSSQLQLLRTSSHNKVRAIEVARTLEQQALLSDFAQQLSKVRSEISHIQAQPSPRERARSRSRRREAERERQEEERDRSRERSKERMRSPQPQSLAQQQQQQQHQQQQQQLAQSSSPFPSAMSPGGSPSARKHMRVRTIGDGTGVVGFPPASPPSSSGGAPYGGQPYSQR